VVPYRYTKVLINNYYHIAIVNEKRVFIFISHSVIVKIKLAKTK